MSLSIKVLLCYKLYKINNIKTTKVFSNGGEVDILSFEVWELKDIWKPQMEQQLLEPELANYVEIPPKNSAWRGKLFEQKQQPSNPNST